MFPAKFEYVRANSVGQALELLRDAGGDGKLIAGGHSLLPLMKLRLAQPRLLVDIGRIPELRFVRQENGTLVIGALATYRDIQYSEEARTLAPIVVEAVADVGDAQVRARGTLAGSLAHADPAADLTAVVLALGATVRTQRASGTRDIPIDDFFVDMLTTVLEENEIITEVRLPSVKKGQGASYLKFDQPASHYALAGVAALVTLSGGRIEAARLGITGVGPKAYRPLLAEQALIGQEPTEKLVKDAVASVADAIDVQGDIHAGPEYRAHLARVSARRAVLAAAASAR